VDERSGSRIASGFCDIASAIDMDGSHLGTENAAKVHDRASASNRMADAFGVTHVSRNESELTNLTQWLDRIGLLWMPLRDADAHAALQQKLGHVAANESAAAEDGYKLFRPVDHGVAR